MHDAISDIHERLAATNAKIKAAERERTEIINRGLIAACLLVGISFFAAAIAAERAFEREDRANQELITWNR
jgi:hypothetical protein